MNPRLILLLGLLCLIGRSYSSRVNPQSPPPVSSCLNLCNRYSVLPAIQDATVANTSGGHVLFLFGGQLTFGFTQFVWDSQGGSLLVFDDSALLTGRLIPLGGPASAGFVLTLSLHLVSTADGFIEVSPISLVSTSSWTFYTINSGSRLVGFGPWTGTEIEIVQELASKPFQIGLGASGKNLDFGAAEWLNLKKNCTIVAGDINVNLNCSICPTGNSMVATAAEADPTVASDTGGFAFTFFLPPSVLAIQNWVFAAPGGKMDFNGNTLHLTGTLVPFSGTHDPLTVDITFVKTSPASPHIELLPGAYAPAGPIDPSTWTFYSWSSPSTVSFDGKVFVLTQQPGATPFQVGVGANGKNLRFGGSGWFDWSYAGTIGSGDININLDCPNGTNPTPPIPPTPPSGCSVSISAVLVSSWRQNGQDFTQWSVTITNTGTLPLLDVIVSLIFLPSDNCGSKPGGTCVNDIWNVVAQGSAYHLPSWQPSIAAGQTFNFGAIVLADSVTWSATGICH